MNETILVEFLVAEGADHKRLIDELSSLDKDFVRLDVRHAHRLGWRLVSGKVDPVYATVIKLQKPFLAERMRVSYIPDDLKNKYRNKVNS